MRNRVILRMDTIQICKVKGLNEKVREMPALLNFSYNTSVISRLAAAELGYLEVTSRLQELEELFHDRVKYFLTTKGIERGYIFKLKSISMAGIKRRRFPVTLLEEELNPHLPVDLILGLDFFKGYKIKIDTVKKVIDLVSLKKT